MYTNPPWTRYPLNNILANPLHLQHSMHFFSFFLFHVLMRVWWSRSSLDPSTLLMTPFLPFLKSPSCNLKPLCADLEIISYSWQLKVFSFFLENCAKDLALKRDIFPVQLGGRSWIFCCQNILQPIYFFEVRVHWKTVGSYEMKNAEKLDCSFKFAAFIMVPYNWTRLF